MGLINGIGVSTSMKINTNRYQSETLTYKARVEADGGAIMDIDSLDADIVLLKATGDYAKFNTIYLPYGGLKLRVAGADNFVIKIYDVTTNNNDAVQTTDAWQPKWGANTFNGINIFTSANSLMLHTTVIPKTFITVNGNGGANTLGIVGSVAGGKYIAPSQMDLRHRTFSLTTVVTLLNKSNQRIDTLVADGAALNVWRNKVLSVSCPSVCAEYSESTQVFTRGTTSYWNGRVGLIMESTQVIGAITRGLIEDYYIAKYAIV